MNKLEPLHPVQVQAYRRMTPTDKHRAYLGMVDCARKLKRSGVRTQHPEWTDEELDRAVARSVLHGFI